MFLLELCSWSGCSNVQQGPEAPQAPSSVTAMLQFSSCGYHLGGMGLRRACVRDCHLSFRRATASFSLVLRSLTNYGNLPSLPCQICRKPTSGVKRREREVQVGACKCAHPLQSQKPLFLKHLQGNVSQTKSGLLFPFPASSETLV